jgi:hypothetical protein
MYVDVLSRDLWCISTARYEAIVSSITWIMHNYDIYLGGMLRTELKCNLNLYELCMSILD